MDELSISQKYALAAKADHILGCLATEWSLATKMILHLDSDDSSSSLHEKYCNQFWSPLYVVNTATVEQVSWHTTKIVGGWNTWHARTAFAGTMKVKERSYLLQLLNGIV